MFPYDQIPVSKIRTSLDIERYGTQSLLRALNIGRVVAFVGSGTSIKFGQPRWEDLKTEAIKSFEGINKAIKRINTRSSADPIKDFIKEYEATLGELSNEITEHRDSGEIDTIHFLGLCEKYFKEIGLLLNKNIEIKQEIDLKKVEFPFDSLESFREIFAERFSSVHPDSIEPHRKRNTHKRQLKVLTH